MVLGESSTLDFSPAFQPGQSRIVKRLNLFRGRGQLAQVSRDFFIALIRNQRMVTQLGQALVVLNPEFVRGCRIEPRNQLSPHRLSHFCKLGVTALDRIGKGIQVVAQIGNGQMQIDTHSNRFFDIWNEYNQNQVGVSF